MSIAPVPDAGIDRAVREIQAARALGACRVAAEERSRAALPRLTPAEQAVFRAILRGLSAEEIAIERRGSAFTVNNHTRKIFAAFGVKSRAELMALFVIAPDDAWYERAQPAEGN